jgi:type IV pilus assembly protein PilB
MTVTTRLPIGQILVQTGYIDPWQLQSALAHQRFWGGKLGAALIKLGFIAESVFLTELARHLGVPYVHIGNRRVPDAVVRLVPERLIRARKVFPAAFAWQGKWNQLVVITSEPQNLAMLDEVAFASGKKVKAALASESDVEQAIERHLGPNAHWNSRLASAAKTQRAA